MNIQEEMEEAILCREIVYARAVAENRRYSIQEVADEMTHRRKTYARLTALVESLRAQLRSGRAEG